MTNEVQAVAKEMGGRAVFGRNLANQPDLRQAIREGFPHGVVAELMKSSGLTLRELAESLDLSARSLQRRRRSGRLARIVALAQESLGDRESAARWLKRSNRALGGFTPVSVIDTELGARQVEQVLGRIAYGGIS